MIHYIKKIYYYLDNIIRTHKCILLIVLFFLCISALSYKYIDYTNDNEDILELTILYYPLALIVSSVLALIAWIQSNKAISQSRTNYLIRIDERWSSAEIIAAREVIHELYLDAKRLNPKYRDNKEQINNAIALSIMQLHDDPNRIDDFIKLLNFLDFLETIGHLYSKDAIDLDETKELLGNSIRYFHQIYAEYIKYRRETKDPDFYKKFEALYDAINKD